MKFPTHIILDVSRPTVVNSKARAGWHRFYRTRFSKTNSAFNRKNLDVKNSTDRILVTKTQATPTTSTDLHIIKQRIISNLTKLQPKKEKYFLPYRSSFSDENLAKVRQSIRRHKKISSLRNPKFDNLVSLNTASTKHRFLSDRVVKDFQLEKELLVYFSSPVLSPVVGTADAKTFKELQALRAKHAREVRKSNPLLVSSSLRKALKKKAESLEFVRSAVQNASKKFCFKSYTVRLKLGQSLNRSWNKRFYSKSLHHPTESRLRSLFNINFLVKEMHYSKLKYSKTAERDIVSSGSAALFAGFIGFLISEKFGIELVDSGDFYFAVMYLVFVGFSFKAFVSGLESHVTDWNCNADRRAYTHKPAKWVTLWSNSFTYFLTVFHLVLRVPHTILHSVYPPFNFTLAEFLNSINFGYVGYRMLKVISYIYDFLTSFPYNDSDRKKR